MLLVAGGLAALIVAGVVAIVALRHIRNGEGRKGLTGAQVSLEYRREESHLPQLPPGDRWAGRHFQTNQGGRGVEYQPGNGQNSADLQWYCDWEQYVLKQSPGSPPFRLGVGYLARIRDTYIYKYDASPGTRESWVHTYKEAELGDLSSLEEAVRANCSA